MTLHELRPFTIGGSETAAACGVDPYCSRVMLWARKTGRVAPPAETEAMLWGTLIEPLILDVLARDHGLRMHEDTEWTAGYRDTARPWYVGHPDAVMVGRDGLPYIVDAKTTGAWSGHAWAEGSAPTAYILQLHAYFHLTGIPRGVLACLVGGQRLHVRTVERDPEIERLMLAGLDEFAACVRRDVPPPPDGSDSAAEALRGLFPGEKGKAVRFTRGQLALVHEYCLRDRQYRHVKRQRDELKQAIQLAMGDADRAENLAGDTVARWTTFEKAGATQRRFTIPTANGDDAA